VVCRAADRGRDPYGFSRPPVAPGRLVVREDARSVRGSGVGHLNSIRAGLPALRWVLAVDCHVEDPDAIRTILAAALLRELPDPERLRWKGTRASDCICADPGRATAGEGVRVVRSAPTGDLLPGFYRRTAAYVLRPEPRSMAPTSRLFWAALPGVGGRVGRLSTI